MQILKMTSLLALILTLTACATPQDLDVPCPDYGKRCPQALINGDLF